jgi:hypothetical protein
MGIGDWVLATAEARHYHEIYELPVVFANKNTGKVYWSEVFENNPKIVKEPKQGQQVVVVENYPGRRPYINLVTKERYHYNNSFFIEAGEIFLSEQEKSRGIDGAVLVEPNTKTEMGLSRNKAWPWERWQELVDSVKAPWVQMGPKGSKVLGGVRFVETPRFRDTFPYINKASLVVTTDGAIHHATAALGKKAVVLWGGVASPDLLGYPTHVNIAHEDLPCGSIIDCGHCRDAMERITVEEVANAIQRLLIGGSQEGRSPESVCEGISG